jgi:RNA polymerase sigma-70 factor (ECF subfamily)
MHRDGARKWPRLSLDVLTFRQYCDRTVGLGLDAEAQRHGADLYLCCACCEKNREAMAILEREGANAAKTAIARVSRDAEFVDETLQEFWSSLFLGSKPKIAGYSARGPLQAWLRVVATRAALDRCRVQRVSTLRHAELVEELAAEQCDPEATVAKREYATALQEALGSAVGKLSPKDRSLLRLQVEERCGIDRIALIHGVHRATAARWLERARTRVFDAARAQLSLRAGSLTESELRSAARAMGSELELKLSSCAPDAEQRQHDSVN